MEDLKEVKQEVKEFKKPVRVVRSGGVVISVWENTNKSGEKFLSCTIKKSYKDDKGEWKNVTSFNKNDLPDVSFACGKAFNDWGDF